MCNIVVAVMMSWWLFFCDGQVVKSREFP